LSNLSKDVTKAGRTILSARPKDALAVLKEALRGFISSDFEIGSGAVFDAVGNSTPSYPVVIYRESADQVSEHGLLSIPADCVAVVIDVYDAMDVEQFRESYARVSIAKQLIKKPVSEAEGNARTNITLGIVFAVGSTVSLDVLADELYRLDLSVRHKQWLDMIVVAPFGVINYALQFPGEMLAGDYLPPR
jgi:hypothetical protein